MDGLGMLPLHFDGSQGRPAFSFPSEGRTPQPTGEAHKYITQPEYFVACMRFVRCPKAAHTCKNIDI